MIVFDDLGDDTPETGVAAAKIAYGDNIQYGGGQVWASCSAESQKGLCTIVAGITLY